MTTVWRAGSDTLIVPAGEHRSIGAALPFFTQVVVALGASLRLSAQYTVLEAGSIEVNGNMIIEGAGARVVAGSMLVSGTVQAVGEVKLEVDSLDLVAGTMKAQALNISLTRLHVKQGAAMSTSGLGWGRGEGECGGQTSARVGGGHGGAGATSSSVLSTCTYGSAVSPVTLGSGGVGHPGDGYYGGSGGGSIVVEASSEVVVDGSIRSDGGAGGGGHFAGSAGGSVWIRTSSWSGTGVVSAKGGYGQRYGGGGGGGRVSVWYRGVSGFVGTLDASGGVLYSSSIGGTTTAALGGGTGTVVENIDGRVVLSISGAHARAWTGVSGDAYTAVGILEVTNGAQVAVFGGTGLSVASFVGDGSGHMKLFPTAFLQTSLPGVLPSGGTVGLDAEAGWLFSTNVTARVRHGVYSGGWSIAGTSTLPVVSCRFGSGMPVASEFASSGLATWNYTCPVPPGAAGVEEPLSLQVQVPGLPSASDFVRVNASVRYTLAAQCDLLPNGVGAPVPAHCIAAGSDEVCDASCNILACDYDSRACLKNQPLPPVFVSTSGSDIVGSGLVDSPFASLARALDVACRANFQCLPVVLLPGRHEVAAPLQLSSVMATIRGVLVDDVVPTLVFRESSAALSLAHARLKVESLTIGLEDHSIVTDLSSVEFSSVHLYASSVGTRMSRIRLTNSIVQCSDCKVHWGMCDDMSTSHHGSAGGPSVYASGGD